MFYIKQTLNFVISIKKYMLYCIERQKMNKKYNIARKILIFWTLFIGIGAVAGAVGMLVHGHGCIASILSSFAICRCFVSKLHFLRSDASNNQRHNKFGCGRLVICKKKGGNNFGHDIWHHANALDYHSICYFPI